MPFVVIVEMTYISQRLSDWWHQCLNCPERWSAGFNIGSEEHRDTENAWRADDAVEDDALTISSMRLMMTTISTTRLMMTISRICPEDIVQRYIKVVHGQRD